MGKIINMDCDGVLLSNRNESLLTSEIESGLSYDDTSPVWDWYDELIHTTTLPINVPMLKVLQGLKDDGHVLRLWTNRAYTLRKPTLDNLGGWKGLFDSFEFHSGRKHLSKVEDRKNEKFVDNHQRYLPKGDNGILYPTFE